MCNSKDQENQELHTNLGRCLKETLQKLLWLLPSNVREAIKMFNHPVYPPLQIRKKQSVFQVYINARILCKISTKSRISTEKHVLGQRMSRKSCCTQVNYHAMDSWLKWCSHAVHSMTQVDATRSSKVFMTQKELIEKVKDSTFTLP